MAPTRAQWASAALLALIVAAAAGSAEAQCKGHECAVCPSGGSTDTISELPRWARGGLASPDLGSYDIFEPDPEKPGEVKTVDVANDITSDGSSNSMQVYADGVGGYVAFALLSAVLLPFCGCCLLWCRCGCCCCRRTGGKCGKRWPTMGRACGFERLPDGTYGYKKSTRIAARLYMIFFFACVGGAIYAGHVGGNLGVKTAMTSASKAPSGVQDLVQGLIDPVGDFVIGITSDTVFGLIDDLREVITDGTDLRAMEQHLTCIQDKMNNLPDTKVLLKFVDDVILSVDALRNETRKLPALVDDVIVKKGNITDMAVALEARINSTKAGISTVRVETANTNATVSKIVDLINDLDNPSSGMQHILGELQTMANTPTTAQKDAAVSATDGSLDDLFQVGGRNGMDGPGNGGDRATLRANLASILATWNAMPDYNATADNMDAFNARIKKANDDQVIGQLLNSITTTQAALAGLPKAGEVNNTINDLVGVVRSFDFGGFRTALLNVNQTMFEFPSFSILSFELAKVKGILAIVPCIKGFTTELLGLDKSAFEIPEDVKKVTDELDNINGTLQDAIQSVEDSQKNIDDFDKQRNDFNVDSFVADLNKMEADVRKTTDDLNVDALLGDMVKMEKDSNVNFTIADDLRELNATMNANQLDPNTIQLVRNFENAKQFVIDTLTTAVADMDKYIKGYCSHDVSVNCTSDSDCTGAATCQSIGIRRCQTNPLANSGTCTQDSDCDSNDRCIIDAQRFNVVVRNSITGPPTAPDTSTVQGNLNNIDGAATIDTGSFTGQLDTAIASMDGVDTDSFGNDIGAITNSLNSFDTTSTTKDINDLTSQMDKIDFSGVRSQTKSLDDQTSSIDSQMDQLNQLKGFVKALADIFVTDWLMWAGRLSKPTLTTERDTGGLSALVLSITDTLDDMGRYVNDSTTLFNFDANTTGMVQGQTARLDLASQKQYRTNGPIYYLAGLSGDSKAEVRESAAGWMVDASYSKAGRMNVDSEGNPYPKDAQCLTQKCIDAEIVFYNEAPLSEVTDGGVPVDFSREQVTLALWLPAILPILATGVLATCCCCTKCWRCAKCCASCQVGCICTFLPLLFIFLAFLWPVVMVFGDVCYSMESVGLQYIKAKGDTLCTDSFNGTGTLNKCVAEIADPVSADGDPITFTIDFEAVYAGIMWGECTKDPLEGVVTSLKSSVGVIPENFVNDFVNNNSSSPIKMRQKLKDAFHTFGSSAGTHMADYIQALSDGGVLDCNTLHGVFKPVKETICCDVLGVFYWLVSSYYLIALSCCCCGTSSGLLGRKRLPAKLWGGDYDANVDLDREAGVGAADAPAAAAEAGGGAAPAAPAATAVALAPAGGAGAARATDVEIEMVEPSSMAPARYTAVLGARVLGRSAPAGTLPDGEHDRAEMTVPRALAAAVKDLPKGAALQFRVDGGGGGAGAENWTMWTWTQYSEQVTKVARAVMALGVGPNESAVLAGPCSPEWAAAHLGIASCGGIAVGINAQYDPESFAEMVRRVNSSVIFVGGIDNLRKVASAAPGMPRLRHIVAFGADVEAKGVPADLSVGGVTVWPWVAFLAKHKSTKEKDLKKRQDALVPEQCAAVFFTAGSEGAPRACMFTHDALTWTGAAVAGEYGLATTDRLVAFTPLDSAFAATLHIYAHMRARCTQFFAPSGSLVYGSDDTTQLVAACKAALPTALFAPPRLFTRLKHHVDRISSHGVAGAAVRGQLGLEETQLLVAHGGRVSHTVMAAFSELALTVYEVYGCTQCLGVATLSTPSAVRVGTVGKPLKGVLVSAASTAELLVNGRNVMMGYVADGAGTAAALEEKSGTLHTGDLTHVTDDNFVMYGGAEADLFTTGPGNPCDPTLVEAALLAVLPIAADVVAVGAAQPSVGALISLAVAPGSEHEGITARLSDEVLALAEGLGSAAKTVQDAMGDGALVGYVMGQIIAANGELPAGSKIERFCMLSYPLSVAAGTAGPLFRIRRATVNARHESEIYAMFQAPAVITDAATAMPPTAAAAPAAAATATPVAVDTPPAAAPAAAAAARPAAVAARSSAAAAAAGGAGGSGTPVAPMAGAASPAAGTMVRKEGSMKKQGRKVKNWQTRWFVLENNRMSYFDGKGGAMKGEVVLNAHSNVSKSNEGANQFALRAAGNRVLICECASVQDRDEWMQALWTNIRVMQSP